jgi:hypothetical protein
VDPVPDPLLLSLVSTTEELLKRKSICSSLKTEITAVGIHRADNATLFYPQKLELTSLTSGRRSFGIVRCRTQATRFLGSKVRPVRRADSLATICEPIVKIIWDP